MLFAIHDRPGCAHCTELKAPLLGDGQSQGLVNLAKAAAHIRASVYHGRDCDDACLRNAPGPRGN